MAIAVGRTRSWDRGGRGEAVGLAGSWDLRSWCGVVDVADGVGDGEVSFDGTNSASTK